MVGEDAFALGDGEAVVVVAGLPEGGIGALGLAVGLLTVLVAVPVEQELVGAQEEGA